MRGLMALVLLAGAVGCKREEAGGGGESPAAQPVKPSETFPAPTAKLRVQDTNELVRFYARDREAKHPHEGKRLLTRVPVWGCSMAQADGKSLLLERDDGGLRRPDAVLVLRKNRSAAPDSDGYVEATLRGVLPLAARPWSKKWLSRSESYDLKDAFVLLEDAVFVAPPKD